MIDFNQMVDNFVARDARQKTYGRYYPSEVGICLRKLWYSYTFPSETKPELLRIFHIGEIIHDFVVAVLDSKKNPEVKLVKSEFPIRLDKGEFIVSGRVDNLIAIQADGRDVLVEVKSASNIDYVQEASPHNVMQLQLYMHITGIHDGILLYVDKKNLQSKVFPVEYNEEEAKQVIERFSQLHSFLTEKKLPEPEARGKREKLWMCRFCEFRDRCYAATPTSEKWL